MLELLTDLGFNAKENPNNMLHRLSQGIASDEAAGKAASKGNSPARKAKKATPPAVEGPSEGTA